MIDEYTRGIKEAVAALGGVALRSSIYNDEREADFLFLRGEILFADGSSLHFREFVHLKVGQPPDRYKYAYHYQRADGTIIFRYDRARRAISILAKSKSSRRMLPIYRGCWMKSKGW